TTLALYLLGTGFSRYLGQRIDYSIFLLGITWVVFLQLGFYFLGDHFKTPFDKGLYNRLPEKNSEDFSDSNQPSEILIYISVSFFAGATVISLILIFLGLLNISSAILMGLFFVGFFLLVVPGISLEYSGIGEIITSITLVIIPPAFAFFLQYGTIHQILTFGIFPLFPLHLALIILLRLSDYGDDQKQNKKNLLVRIGWIQGIYIHNLMILTGFLLFGAAAIFGFPVRLVGLVFLTLPVAVYLIYYLSQLEDGAPVRWPLLRLLSMVVFFLPVYLLTYSSWVK
ncbi:MAG: prenyltransferase, partial [Anaerolineales bacterium]|nr:prenyltransferase [Anaerolineales bacterium]